jgi:manganese-dependent inorganic pyrophosphatase
MSQTIVIGHRNPDTDAICSAIGYAEFKRRTGTLDVIAARCGATNSRIDFVLREFGVPAPMFISDVSPRVGDLMQQNVIAVPPSATVSEALRVMDERNIRVLPVVDKERRCAGLVSVFKMSKVLFPSSNLAYSTRLVRASIGNLVRTLGAELIVGDKAAAEEEFVMMIGAMTNEEFTARLPNYEREKLLVVVGDRENIQRSAIAAGVSVLVVTGGLPVEKDICEAAAEQGVCVLVSPHDTATTAVLCRTAVMVCNALHEHYLSFGVHEPMKAIRAVAAASNFQAFPVTDGDDRVVGIFSKTDLIRKVDRKLILVDHNELTQAVTGADQVEIVEIIDHHRIGSLSTQQPILFRNEPVGSTSTIVAECFFNAQMEMPKPIAGLLLAGLASDTLNLTSPTATERDAIVLRRLEELSDVDAADFTQRLFASGSLLITSPPAEAITADCKEYVEDGRTFSLAQIEEIGFSHFELQKEEVIAELGAYRERTDYYFAALLVTDVVRQASLLIVAGEDEFHHTIHYPRVEPGIYELQGVVSRKKQLLPYITNCLAHIGGGFGLPEADGVV